MQVSASATADGLTWKGNHNQYTKDPTVRDVNTYHSFNIAAEALRFSKAALISSPDDLACSQPGFPMDNPIDRE